MKIFELDEDAGKLLNVDKLKHLLSLYKFPLILAGIGLIFLLVGIAFALKTQYASQEVVFSEATSSAKTKIQVDVEGAVMSPGVYEVEEGSRITAALAAAGGLSAAADRNWIAKNMNLAAKVVDGGKIYIPPVGEATVWKQPTTVGKSQDLSSSSNFLGVTTGLVNLNTALQAELEALPGVGPVTAGKIMAGRPYQSVEELKNRKIIGQSLYHKLKDLLRVF